MDYTSVMLKFKEAGYSMAGDVEHLKEITELELFYDIRIMKIGQ